MIALPRKIVLCGVSGSGKSTLGINLQKRFGHNPVAFADPLKRAAKLIFGFSVDDLWGHSHLRETPYKQFVFSGYCLECQGHCAGPERTLPILETDEANVEQRCQEYDDKPDYWLCECCGSTYPKYVTPREALKTLGTAWGRKFCPDLWAQACFGHMSKRDSYVVTDCRFFNEWHAASRNNACIVLLERGLAESTSPHPSEAEVRRMAESRARFDITLNNTTGTAEENCNQLVERFAALQEEIEAKRYTRACPIEWTSYEDRWRGR